MTKFKSRRQVRYSAAYKKSIVKEVLSSHDPLTVIAKRNRVGVSSINRWLDKYEQEFISTLVVKQEVEKMSKPRAESEDNELCESEMMEIKIAQLEQALRLSELKNDAYERMIRIAESEFKISIKKKRGI